jgi:urease accessory protein
MLTAILQSVSGGMYEREHLTLSLTAEAKAQVHCTTQSATVVHSMSDGGEASQTVTLHAAKGSFVEYLPDALILFPNAGLRTSLHVEVEDDATVIFSDAFLTHDPKAQGRSFRSLHSETVMQHVNGRRLCVDRFEITGEELRLAFAGYNAQGTMWIHSSRHGEELLSGLRKRLESILGIYAGVSSLPYNAGVWVRLLAVDGVALHKGLHAAWMIARRVLTGEEPQSRRKTGWE